MFTATRQSYNKANQCEFIRNQSDLFGNNVIYLCELGPGLVVMPVISFIIMPMPNEFCNCCDVVVLGCRKVECRACMLGWQNLF